MLTTKEKKNLLINSLGIFLLAFFSVKVTIILVKLIVAWLFGIETTLVNFRIMGISAANSGVWSIKTIYAFYSIDLVVSLFFILQTLILFRSSYKKRTRLRVYYLWLGFSAMHNFFAALVAGILTHTNVYHFVKWLYIPNYFIMLIVLAILPLTLIFGWLYNKQFLITSPVHNSDSRLNHQRVVLFYGMFLPLLVGLLIICTPLSLSFHRYEFYEFAILLIMAFPVLLYFYPYNNFSSSTSFSETLNIKSLYIGIGSCAIFLIINIITFI